MDQQSSNYHFTSEELSAYLDNVRDELERHRAENKRLRAALDPFARHAHCTDQIDPPSLALWCAQALNALAMHKSNADS